MTIRDRTANVLGAVALVLTDRAVRSGPSPTTAAALSAMHQFLDHPTLDELRQVLGLTHSGAVRLVDRLAAAGLVTRGAGGDGRSRSVTLTAAGRRTAEQIATERLARLAGALDGLSPAEQETLHALLGRVMTTVVGAKDGGAWICRLCDLTACGRPDGLCPAANAAAAKYGPPDGPPGRAPDRPGSLRK